MDAVTIEKLLENFVAYSEGIQGVVMVSAKGQLLTHPRGFSRQSIHILASRMLYLADCVSEVCQWETVEWIVVQAQEGYLILTQCSLNAFLIIKATAAPSGYLRIHIQRHINKLRTALQVPNQGAKGIQTSYRPNKPASGNKLSSTANAPAKRSPASDTITQQSNLSLPLHLNEFEINYCQKELTERIGPIASIICNRILEENPNLRSDEFINALSQHIPDQITAFEFRKQLLSNIMKAISPQQSSDTNFV